MSNIFSHNRLPFKCKLSYKGYWDFHLHLGREYGTVLPGMQTGCLSAFIDTGIDECVTESGLESLKEYPYEKCRSKGIELPNFGLTGVDNGRVVFDRETVTDDEFEQIFKKTKLTLDAGDCKLKVYPVSSNLDRFSYGTEFTDEGCGRVAKLYGGFFQGFFRTGDGCDYSVLPSDIGDGLSLEFELCRKDLREYDEENTLNGANPENKGIFFYWGTRAENKWVRYYGEECDEEKEPDETDLETSDGTPLYKPTSNPVETDNKFLTYTRTCGGHTVLNDKEGEPYPTIKIDAENTVLPDNPFLIYSRTCGGTTVLNDDKYFKEHAERYNIYNDLWKNAFAFQVTDDGKVGYKYLVKDCDAENPSCSYKILSEFSNPDNVPYGEWVNIHVRILPCGTENMRLLFYVDGRLVLYSKELPKLNLRELYDSSDKQEGVPFNISLGGGTQGLAETVYEDWRTYGQTPLYPLQKEFGGSFIGFFKSFKFYSCSLNYNQINMNVNKKKKECNDAKIYCGALVFDTKPSKTPVTEQGELIKLLNEYPQNTLHMDIRLLPDVKRKYFRLIVAVPQNALLNLKTAVDGMAGLPSETFNGEEITEQFNRVTMGLEEGGEMYDVWYYTYATQPKYKNMISIDLENNG